jgi:hypothetical protein
MLPDNRLDFISNIDPRYIDRMTTFRTLYQNLDELIRLEFNEDIVYPNEDAVYPTEAFRTAALARTNLETSLQYAIKTLCLLGEIKDTK